MKKRYILFGYQIQNGAFAIVQQEATAVKYIFDAYSNGDSLQQIATHLSSCGPPYRFSDNRWNKNIIAKLLIVRDHKTIIFVLLENAGYLRETTLNDL